MPKPDETEPLHHEDQTALERLEAEGGPSSVAPASPAPAVEDRLDEGLEESFPASDPLAVH
jgi:hypothetical protein